MHDVFKIIEEHPEVFEKDFYGDIWAINSEKAINILEENGIKNAEIKLAVIADYYVVDID